MAQDDPFGTSPAPSDRNGPLAHLASEVISVLCDRQTRGHDGARQFIVDYLRRASISEQVFEPLLVLETLRGHRLTIDEIIDIYIPAVAIALGDDWVSSELDFATVTIGSMRLQALLTEAAYNAPVERLPDGHTPLALVVVSENEQHFLGASVVSAQLRRLGCDVATLFCERRQAVETRILFEKPDMVLFTCARVAGLATIAKTVKTLRTRLKRAPILALGGAIEGNDEAIREKTDVDLVSRSAKDVLSLHLKRRKALGTG